MIHCENIQSMKSGYSGAKTMRTAAYNSGLMGSKTFSTLSTAIGESRLEYCDTTLLLSDLNIGNYFISCLHQGSASSFGKGTVRV